MRAIYLQPGNISLEQARQFEWFDDAGLRRQHYWNPNTNGGENIFWMLNRTIRAEERNRVLGMASLRYQFTESLSLLVRSSFDQIFENQSYKQYNDTYTIADNGNLSLDNRHAVEMNNDFLLNYNTLFVDVTTRNDWSSTLPKDNWSYIYPSVGLTWIFTEVLGNTPDYLTFSKVRASYA